MLHRNRPPLDGLSRSTSAVGWSLKPSAPGAHFNPIVTLVDCLLGSISARDTAFYTLAQIAGGCVGTVLAKLMFELDAVNLSTTERSS